jgi:hypothetical protein
LIGRGSSNWPKCGKARITQGLAASGPRKTLRDDEDLDESLGGRSLWKASSLQFWLVTPIRSTFSEFDILKNRPIQISLSELDEIQNALFETLITSQSQQNIGDHFSKFQTD